MFSICEFDTTATRTICLPEAVVDDPPPLLLEPPQAASSVAAATDAVAATSRVACLRAER
jgi:hypothetical protein